MHRWGLGTKSTSDVTLDIGGVSPSVSVASQVCETDSLMSNPLSHRSVDKLDWSIIDILKNTF